MLKYSEKIKLKVVKYCIEQHHGYRDASKLFGISVSCIRAWVRRYKEHGIQGLSKNKSSSYSGEFKQNVIEYMHNNHLSFQETAYHFKLGSHHIVDNWERIYYEKGPQALYKEPRVGNKKMSSKSRKKKLSSEVEENLIAENRKLRMENEYLKKLNALVQERIKRENKKK